jgi:hypothetical protein
MLGKIRGTNLNVKRIVGERDALAVKLAGVERQRGNVLSLLMHLHLILLGEGSHEAHQSVVIGGVFVMGWMW